MISIKETGKLKIFFGYASGVGKTEAMVKSACFSKAGGEDVVAGFPLPGEIPGLTGGQRGGEFDLDEALKRNPDLLLIDRLAHTNAPGCRHLKRYQDVEELLRAGINVYTTLNVGELESFKDLTFLTADGDEGERVPDHIFDMADQVEFIDLSPEELLQKRKADDNGGAHIGGVTDPAGVSPAGLAALREIALRRLVDRFNRIEGLADSALPPGTREHVLLCLSSAPSNAKVIRTAVRLAEVFHGNLTALFVESADHKRENPEALRRLKENMELAEDLGARIATVYGDDPALQIAEYARVAGVSKVVLGRANAKKVLFFKKKNLVDRLMQMMPEIDVYIIPDMQKPFWSNHFLSREKIGFSGREFMKVFLIEAAASLTGYLFYRSELGQENIITIYILGVLFSAIWVDGWIYGVINSMLGVVIFNFLFTEPRFTLAFYDARYAVTFIVMLIASLVTSSFTDRVKKQAKKEARKAYRTEVLLETSHKLQKTEGTEGVMTATAEQLCKLLDRSVIFYPVIPEEGLGNPVVFPAKEEDEISSYTTPDEMEAARWVYHNNKHAGATTNTLPETNCLYLAVRGKTDVLAVAGIAMGKTGKGERRELDAYERNLMLAMIDECGLVLEKHILDEERKKAEMKAERETLRANLLRAISHDLRTPLTSIIGNAGILTEKSDILEENKKHQLCVDIYDDATWLVNLVENLLSITRIENGSMDLKVEAELLDDVFQEALSHLDRKAPEHEIRVELPDDLIMARMDVHLIVQVLINIVNNAIKYTQKGSSILLSAKKQGDMVAVTIADNGPGIPDEAKKNLFDMFTTAGKKRGDSRRGLGLGLALCKSIIDAHGGELTLTDNDPQGAVFSFTLQIAEVSSYE